MWTVVEYITRAATSFGTLVRPSVLILSFDALASFKFSFAAASQWTHSSLFRPLPLKSLDKFVLFFHINLFVYNIRELSLNNTNYNYLRLLFGMSLSCFCTRLCSRCWPLAWTTFQLLTHSCAMPLWFIAFFASFLFCILQYSYLFIFVRGILAAAGGTARRAA